MTTDNRSINIAIWTLPTGEDCRVTVAYPTFAGLERAYSVTVQPIERREHADGATIEVYTPSRGYRSRLEAAARYSRKRLEALAADPATFDLARRMFDRCAADVGGAA